MDEAASVQAARTRARRRLIGAAVLVGVGIIGFPLLFETQPRPIAVDIPIEIPSREGVPPLSQPAPKRGAPAAPRVPAPVITERAADLPADVAAQAASAPAPSAAASSAASAVAASAALRGERAATVPSAAARVAASAPEVDLDAQRAKALLEGKPTAPSGASAAIAGAAAAASAGKDARFVVQAGAYTDATALREARQKVEKLGMKTYTQVVETESGARTRVRVGPFATREDAEKAAARIKGSGLAANILSL
ncbi:MAG: SPOR domain-containing protein [Rubrivivax sp.]